MNTHETIETLKKLGGNYWEGYGKRRVYFDIKTVLDITGNSVSYYKTGNISGSTLGSNSSARKILGAIDKIWYDVSDNKFHMKSYSDYANDLFNEFVSSIRGQMTNR